MFFHALLFYKHWTPPFLFFTCFLRVFFLGFFHVFFIAHRIHGAAIYGVPWIPSRYPSHVSINIPPPWIRHG